MGDKEKITELISSLGHAAQMAEQIGTAVTQNHLFEISASLHLAHHNLSAFLTPTIPSTEVGKSPSPLEPMQLGEEEEEEEENDEVVEEERNSEVEMVEEKMKECFIRNKRPKRRLSPSSAAAVESSAMMEERSGCGNGNGFDFDPYVSKLRALDLIYQFHS